MITVTIDNASVLAALSQLRDRVDNPAPALSKIGERLTESTQARFNTSTGPDGQRWAPNSQATILDYLRGPKDAPRSGIYGKKTGKITAKGAGYAMNKKPLVASGVLQDSIDWQLSGREAVIIGTDRFTEPPGGWDAGAAVHQFGSKNGKIPARPFLGVSADDERTILEILTAHLSA